MKRVLPVLLMILALTACASGLGAIPSESTQSPDAPIPTLPSTAAEAGVPSPASGWVEYRDARYGYGLALPCYWLVSPTPPEGTFAVMTTRSFTDEFRAAHSERGVWLTDTWPPGAMKLDVLVVEDLDPSLNLPDTVRQFYALYANEQELQNIEEIPLGRAGRGLHLRIVPFRRSQLRRAADHRGRKF